MRTGLWPLPPPRTIGKGDASGSSGSGAAPSLIPTNIVGYWKKDDLSGVDTDSAGANNLTDVNGVTSIAGKVGTARQYTAASLQYHSIADPASLSMGDIAFYLAGWALLDSLGAQRTICGKGVSTGVGNHEFYLVVAVDNVLRFSVSNGVAAAIASGLAALSLSTWHFIEAYHDPATNLIGVAIDNGAFGTTALTTGSWDSTHPFRFGTLNTTTQMWNGAQDEWLIAKSIPTQAQRDYLWDTGAGRTLFP